MNIDFDNSYARLPEKFYSNVKPTPVKSPNIIKLNNILADDLGIKFDNMRPEIFFSGNSLFSGSQPIAMAYAGHQFGNWVPQLGDGRAILLGEIIFSYVGMKYGIGNIPGSELFVTLSEVENTRALGKVIYTDYIYLFQCAGLILLVAMIGAIVLTHRKRDNVRKQDAVKQTLRDKSESIEINKVEIGKGAK